MCVCITWLNDAETKTSKIKVDIMRQLRYQRLCQITEVFFSKATEKMSQGYTSMHMLEVRTLTQSTEMSDSELPLNVVSRQATDAVSYTHLTLPTNREV